MQPLKLFEIQFCDTTCSNSNISLPSFFFSKPSDKKSALYKEYASALKRDEESVLLSDLKVSHYKDVSSLSLKVKIKLRIVTRFIPRGCFEPFANIFFNHKSLNLVLKCNLRVAGSRHEFSLKKYRS